MLGDSTGLADVPGQKHVPEQISDVSIGVLDVADPGGASDISDDPGGQFCKVPGRPTDDEHISDDIPFQEEQTAHDFILVDQVNGILVQ